MPKLYDFQQRTVDYMKLHNYVICGLEVGLGKTVCALTIATEENLKTLIVVPAYLRANWHDEIVKFYPDHLHLFTVTSYASFKKVKAKDFDCIIADEAHMLKNLSAKRTIYFHEFVDEVKPKRLMLLSGSILKNHIGDLFSPLALCSYSPIKNNGKDITDRFTSTWSFNRFFSNPVQKRIGHRVITQFNGTRNIPILKTYLEDKYIRIKVRDALDLPEQVTKFIRIEKPQYEDELRDAYELYENGSCPSHISKIKKVSALAKISTTIEHAKTLLRDTDKLVIFSDHVESVHRIREGLSEEFSTAVITGSVDTDIRSHIVRKFQKNDLQIIVATIGAMSTGVTVTAASHMIFNDYSWSAADIYQAMGRIHRISQTRTCFYHVILASGVDGYIFKKVQEKKKLLKTI